MRRRDDEVEHMIYIAIDIYAHINCIHIATATSHPIGISERWSRTMIINNTSYVSISNTILQRHK